MTSTIGATSQDRPARVGPKYSGVPVWETTDRPLTLLRHVALDETMEVVEELPRGWIRVRLSEGLEGYVRQATVDPAERMAAVRLNAAGRRESDARKSTAILSIALLVVAILSAYLLAHTGKGILGNVVDLSRGDSGTRMELSDSCYYDLKTGDLICR
jgi:hypothetical protein